MAAAGITGNEEVRVADRPLFVKSLDALEAPEIQLLRVLRDRPDWDRGPATRADIDSIWPGADGNLDHIVAVLVSEGLARQSEVATHIGWQISDYGLRFLEFVRTGQAHPLNSWTSPRKKHP